MAAIIAGGMVLFPPWSHAGTRISSAGYGFLFTGPISGGSGYRLDTSRLLTQLVFVFLAGAVGYMVMDPTKDP